MNLLNSCAGLVCVLLFTAVPTTRSTITRYYTYENHSPGTEIGMLSQDLKMEPGEDPQTSFRFMQEANSSHVALRPSDGLLTVGESIDREELCSQAPKCLITFDIVAFSKDKFQLIHVEIEVRDINDNSPRFPSNESYLEISENLAVGTRFLLDVAIDGDVGGNYIQSYQVSFNSHFGVEVSEGEDGLKYAELILLERLDREVEDFYTVEVTAVDGGDPPRSGSMTVHIKVLDFNDNSPTFQRDSLQVELKEDAPLGHLLLKVSAFDPDDGINGQVVYGFVQESSGEVRRVFQIDPFSGCLTLKAAVDYETRRSYELIIQAYDLGLNSVPSTCRVTVEIIDVNDNAPEISIRPMTSMSDGVAYITEAAAQESFVALVSASDGDSGPNGYVRLSLHGHHHFKLQQAYGDNLMIMTTAALDRERIAEYNLTVVAEDLGSPPFKTLKPYTIRVSDQNDNPPCFSKPVYELAIMENSVPGSYIATVVARDPDVGDNSKVTYQVLDGEAIGGAPASTYVSVDPLSGSLYAVRSLDREAVKQVTVAIQATDSGSPQLSATAVMEIRVVDQNDNSPYITHPLLQNDSADVPIPYNAPPGYLALRLKARDADEGVNGELSFRLTEDDQMLFSIDRDSGDIVLKYGLSFLCGDLLRVKVTVSDNGRSPRSCNATIHFVVTEMQPAVDQGAPVLQSSEDSRSNFDVSQVVIVILGGGCALLVIAIVTVALCSKRNPLDRDCDGKQSQAPEQFKSFLPTLSHKDSDMYQGPRALVSGPDPPSQHDSMTFPGGTRNDSENKDFSAISMKHFEPEDPWQRDKYTLQISGERSTDQLSVKDSGKGDSDFNDSDSDISGYGCKKSPTVFNPQATGSFNSASTFDADPREKHSTAPTHLKVARGATYTITFSQMPIRGGLHVGHAGWTTSGYGTRIPKARVPLQTFPRSGTMPMGFGQHRYQAETRHGQGPTATALSEVATAF